MLTVIGSCIKMITTYVLLELETNKTIASDQ